MTRPTAAHVRRHPAVLAAGPLAVARALLGGRLLGPAQLAEMKRTVPTDDSVQQILPGARYGLGIMNIPLRCDGSYWTNSGSDPGWGSDSCVTPDGRRSVVTSWSTEDVTDQDNALQQARAFVGLTQNALCR